MQVLSKMCQVICTGGVMSTRIVTAYLQPTYM